MPGSSSTQQRFVRKTLWDAWNERHRQPARVARRAFLLARLSRLLGYDAAVSGRLGGSLLKPESLHIAEPFGIWQLRQDFIDRYFGLLKRQNVLRRQFAVDLHNHYGSHTSTRCGSQPDLDRDLRFQITGLLAQSGLHHIDGLRRIGPVFDAGVAEIDIVALYRNEAEHRSRQFRHDDRFALASLLPFLDFALHGAAGLAIVDENGAILHIDDTLQHMIQEDFIPDVMPSRRARLPRPLWRWMSNELSSRERAYSCWTHGWHRFELIRLAPTVCPAPLFFILGVPEQN